MRSGKPNPDFKRDPITAALDKLRDDEGLHRIRWSGTITRLREAGIPITEKSFATDWVPSGNNDPRKKREGHAGTEDLSYWAPRWAVLVAEAEPCSELAREWALWKATKDEGFRDALMTVAVFGDLRRMGDFVMAQWITTDDDVLDV